MIRLLFASSLKNKLSKWWNEKTVQIKSEYEQKEKDYISEFDKKYSFLQKELSEKLEVLEKEKRNLEDIQTRVSDREKELVRVNEDLKVQIRLIEAKASPDHVWESAFSLGVSKSWDMMVPLMTKGIDKLKEKIRAQEIEASFPRIDLIVTQRIKEMESTELTQVNDIKLKRKEFEKKLSEATNHEEKKKLSNYISALDWVLGARNGN